MSSFTSRDERDAREGTAEIVLEEEIAAAVSSAAEAAPAIPDPAESTPHPAEPIRHPACGAIELAAVLHALSDPVRLQIVGALANGGEVNCKSFALPVSKSTCTHHFRVLREAGVIKQRVEGTTRLNSLRRDDLESQFPGLIDAVLGAGRASS